MVEAGIHTLQIRLPDDARAWWFNKNLLLHIVRQHSMGSTQSLIQLEKGKWEEKSALIMLMYVVL